MSIVKPNNWGSYHTHMDRVTDIDYSYKQTDAELVQQTIELINSYNAGKERCLMLTGNFNEIRPPHTSIDGVDDCVRDPDTRSNNFSKPSKARR